jgi:hypothetical protein
LTAASCTRTLIGNPNMPELALGVDLSDQIARVVVVLGGTIPESGNLMLEGIRLECRRRLRPAQSERVRIVLSTLGADGVAIGAARAAARPTS